MGPEMQALLSDANVALGQLEGSIRTLPDPDMFVLMYIRQEAALSSQIEGTQSSLYDLVAAEAEIMDPHRPQDVEEIINYVAAMNYGLARLESLPISLRLIREIHERLVRGVRGEHLTPGEFRKTQNWVGGSGPSNATCVPPPPHEAREALGDLERFLHSATDLPLLVKVGLAHAQFETIHPFLDGNGRVGRLLITFLLCESGVLTKPVLYLSHYFKQRRQEYYDRLQAIRDRGEWEQWLTLFLRGVSEVGREAADKASRIVALRERHRSLILEELGQAAGSGLRLLEQLYRHPILSVNTACDLTGAPYPTMNQLVSRLESLGVLRETTGQRRNRSFAYTEYIRLFGEEPLPGEEGQGGDGS
jgi:Fic family protein